jgi:hypothetical protein
MWCLPVRIQAESALRHSLSIVNVPRPVAASAATWSLHRLVREKRMVNEQGLQSDGWRRARAWLRPWTVAAVACGGSYVLVQVLGAGRFRSEFLGASLALGVFGGILLVGFRAFRWPVWLRWLGVFCLNWLFAAYAIAFFAV